MYTKFFPKIRSKNYSVKGLRRSQHGLSALPIRSVVRFGSTASLKEVFGTRAKLPIVEVNSVESVKNSSSKLKMKAKFLEAGVPQAEWWVYAKKDDKGLWFHSLLNESEPLINIKNLPYPILAKKVFGAKAVGMEKFDTIEALQEFLKTDNSGYYFEQYINYSREYRLHCTKYGCFYTCRKMLKDEADTRWYRNDSNCVWILEENPLFDKPVNWKAIEASCLAALEKVGLDFGAFDIRVQSSKKKDPQYIIIEVNSAPALGTITETKYKELLPDYIMKKAKELNYL